MSHIGNSDGLMSDINVTPLVDVMLVLLIIFMVAAPMMTQGVDVTLPTATSQSLEAAEPLIITIDKNQQIYGIDFNIGLENLGPKLQEVLKLRTDKSVYLRADQELPYGFVVQVMAAIRSAGVEKLGMVTDPVLEKDKQG